MSVETRSQDQAVELQPLVIETGAPYPLGAEATIKARLAATHDPLTNSLNRRGFNEALEREFRVERRHQTSSSMALIFFDLDGFKGVNDTLGHDAGDEILKEFTKIVQESIRPTDYLGRFGGDEFALLLTNNAEATMNLGVAGAKAEELREKLEESFRDKGGVTASIGVVGTRKNDSPEDLMIRADQAMYIAKQQKGKNIVYVEVDEETPKQALPL